MKKWTSALLCLTLLLGLLGGCGSGEGSSAAPVSAPAQDSAAASQTESTMQGEKVNIDVDMNLQKSKLSDIEEMDSSEEAQLSRASTGTSGSASSSGTTLNNVDYVMIYNPYIYHESDDSGNVLSKSLTTGDLSGQIVTGMNRAGGLETNDMPEMISQAQINAGFDDSDVDRSGVRAGGKDPSYKVGDTHEFYHMNINVTARVQNTFQCIYAGEHCYIWSMNNSISEKDAKSLAEQFDSKIYQQDVDAFGKARFTDNGGKVNMLFYPMQEGIGGFFCNFDIFSSSECPDVLAEARGYNTDHAIININSDMLNQDLEFVQATLSHEFQHLICATDALYYAESPFMETWLNESMSAYAEELIYPGRKEENNYNDVFYLSDSFREGQSLYNFDTDHDSTIGAYGAVYLYSKYLNDLAGNDVFSKVHAYWRESYSADVTEAEALMNAVPSSVQKDIDSKYSYPSALSGRFDTDADQWMSKLTLDFYVKTLDMDFAGLADVADQAHLLMLYSNAVPADIEGGGRIVVATQNGSYTVPSDADQGLVYIGLDQNFNVVTDPVYTVGSGSSNSGSSDKTGSSGNSGTSGGNSGTIGGTPTSSSSGFQWNKNTDAVVIGPASMGDPIQKMMDGFETALTGEKFKVQSVDKSKASDITEWLNLAAASGDLDSVGVLAVVLPTGSAKEMENFYSALQYCTGNGTAVFLMTAEEPMTNCPWTLWFNISGMFSSTEEFASSATGDIEGVAQTLADTLLELAGDNKCWKAVVLG